MENNNNKNNNLTVPFLILLVFLLLGGLFYLIYIQEQPNDSGPATVNEEVGVPASEEAPANIQNPSEVPSENTAEPEELPSGNDVTPEENNDRTDEIDEDLVSLDEIDLSSQESELGDDNLTDL